MSLRTTLLDTTWTIALYDSQGRNFYAVSGRDLQRRDVEIVLAPSEDGGSAGVPLSRDTPASSITVSVRDPRGIAVVEAPLNGSSYASEAASALALSTCAIRERQRL
ncbi:MAG: hypothetical protein R3D33_15435 [Hyphomicrobiaceae bacterium]